MLGQQGINKEGLGFNINSKEKCFKTISRASNSLSVWSNNSNFVIIVGKYIIKFLWFTKKSHYNKDNSNEKIENPKAKRFKQIRVPKQRPVLQMFHQLTVTRLKLLMLVKAQNQHLMRNARSYKLLLQTFSTRFLSIIISFTFWKLKVFIILIWIEWSFKGVIVLKWSL